MADLGIVTVARRHDRPRSRPQHRSSPPRRRVEAGRGITVRLGPAERTVIEAVAGLRNVSTVDVVRDAVRDIDVPGNHSPVLSISLDEYERIVHEIENPAGPTPAMRELMALRPPWD